MGHASAASLSHLELRAVLDGLEFPAVIIDGSYRVMAANPAYQERFGGGGDVTGRHCYEVSHRFARPCSEAGESCPLERALGTRRTARALHIHHTSEGAEHEEVTLQPLAGPDGNVALYLEQIHPTRVASARPLLGALVGRSGVFNAMIELVMRAAPSDASVLLLGESGTGKEMVARAVHDMSPRASRPFVPLDCSGLNESLFESELFGHEKGAFTGAHVRRRGLVESAHGGTLFLDEVGDIPLSQQVKLLRLLETGMFRRVGNVEVLHSSFRLICATHRDLARMVEEGCFRRDLYYRLNAFPIRLPALRERREDIPLLVESFLQRPEFEHIRSAEPAVLDALSVHPFPGNVRELYNVLERACLLADGDTLAVEHLPAEVRGTSERARPHPAANGIIPLAEAESRYLRWVVSSFRGERSALAHLLGLSERTLYRKLEGLRLNGPRVRRAEQ
jgi:DNA-binding NtrC family response regulator